MTENTPRQGARLVTFTGDLGSGKSIISKRIAEMMGAKRHSAGDINRMVAAKADKSTLELNNDKVAIAWLDQQIDGQLQSMAFSEEDLVIDARMGWHFIPDSFRVKFLTKPIVAAQRIVDDQTRGLEKYSSVQEAEVSILQRQNLEWARFERQYGAVFSDDENFDLVVDTSFASLDQIFDVVADCMQKYFAGSHFNKHWVSPLQLIPTEDVIDKAEALCDEWAPSMAKDGYAGDYPVVIVNIEGDKYLFDGHKRTFGAASADIGLIPALVFDDQDAHPSCETYGKEIRNAFRLSYIYDWQDGINCCRRQVGNASIKDSDFKAMHHNILATQEIEARHLNQTVTGMASALTRLHS